MAGGAFDEVVDGQGADGLSRKPTVRKWEGVEAWRGGRACGRRGRRSCRL